MTEDIIQIKKNNVRRLKIVDIKGEPTGDYLEFQIDDVELPLKYQEIQERIKKNQQWIRNQELIIKKRQDVKGKKMLSKNQEDLFRAYNEFYKRQKEVYDMFLGEGGVDKLLAGRKLSWETFEEFDEIIENQILPYLDNDASKLIERIEKKYGTIEPEKNVIK